MNTELEWYDNTTIWVALVAWLTAQIIKMLIAYMGSRRIDFSTLVSTGGMPSAHSSMVCGLATSVGLRGGFGTPLFATTLAFALIVMFDAQSVRHAAGLQARLLNQIVDEMFTSHKFSEQKLVELLGHTRLEVFFGFLTGVIIALGMHSFFGF